MPRDITAQSSTSTHHKHAMASTHTTMPTPEAARLHGIMRGIQKRFVVDALADALQPHSATESLDVLVAAVAAHCRANGADFSHALVRELIIEVAGMMGYDGPND